jgi:hypothetical protein
MEMKKVLSIILSALLMAGGLTSFGCSASGGTDNKAEVDKDNYSFVIDSEGVTRLEAEDVDTTYYYISANNRTKVVERADASGGKFLAAATGAVQPGQYFEFKFT